MGIRWVRDDILFCLVISLMLAAGAGTLAERAAAGNYESYAEKHRVPDGEVGGKAVESVFRARSVEDILAHEQFTVECSLSDAMSYGRGYYGKEYLRLLPLESGETVAAAINLDGTSMKPGTDFLDDDYIMPVGRVVYADLAGDEKFMSRIESMNPLTRTDFYIDMWGTGPVTEEREYIKTRVSLAKTVTGVVSFPLLHMLGSGLGVYPYIFAPGKKKRGKNDKDNRSGQTG